MSSFKIVDIDLSSLFLINQIENFNGLRRRYVFGGDRKDFVHAQLEMD